MEMLDHTVCKNTVDLSVHNHNARDTFGTNNKIWADLVDLFRTASPSLEHRSYGPVEPTGTAFDGPNSNVIVMNSITLLKDLQRLDNMLAFARNVLTAGEKVQNVAAQLGFDREICSLINLCIKITARGYDGDGPASDEDQWQRVINGFKKLLITSLQFLSNLVTRNERLKLMLWVELFDSPTDLLGNPYASQPQMAPPEPDTDMWMRSIFNSIAGNSLPSGFPSMYKSAFTPYLLFAREEEKNAKSVVSKGSGSIANDLASEISKRWQALSFEDREKWQLRQKEVEKLDGSDILGQEAAKIVAAASSVNMAIRYLPNGFRNASPDALSIDAVDTATEGARKLREGKSQLLKKLESIPGPLTQPPTMLKHPDQRPEKKSTRKMNGQSGQQTKPQSDQQLEAKLDDQLIADHQSGQQSDQQQSPQASLLNDTRRSKELSEPLEDPEEDSDEEHSSDEDDYAVPGEDGRGLLTDVPLILGPNEIEVLPMIIMSGIVPPVQEPSNDSSHETEQYHSLVNMYTIRCHLLLAQENGRNLLRELLIFVAAWDLREEELYFKFMIKILEAILIYGLMPFAYGAFKESKDIISPAQAVIMKLLTKIFHARHGFVGQIPWTPNSPSVQAVPTTTFESVSSVSSSTKEVSLLRYDRQIAHCLFTEFRKNIIPQICALIFLQGQIRLGHAHLEDFPLNLWDMERMYEGVYQYLEFFAILTDHEPWKQTMAGWEIASELVTLLKELELAIPKKRANGDQRRSAAEMGLRAHSGSAGALPNTPNPKSSDFQPELKTVSVERPFDSPEDEAISDMTPINGAGTTDTPATCSPYPEPLHDEPADFEWRNLKKLCVLVLSSLVWKNRRLQDQIRDFGGVATILSCCSEDEHNPYIREHAIMCLRFLLENNTENQRVVKELAEGNWSNAGRKDDAEIKEKSKVDVPPEVLDHHGYETFMDAKGQVGLRRKETTSPHTSGAVSKTNADAPSASASLVQALGGKKTGMLEPGVNLPDWMQMVMKNMPR